MAIYINDGTILTDGANGIATSEDCCCGDTNEQWKKCSDDTNAAVLSPGHTTVDYAWLCLSGVWVKCYKDSTTETAATDPNVLEQCDDASPTECADLLGWPASDDFGGLVCNSGAVDDTNWDIRWANELATPTIYTTRSISAGKLNLSNGYNGGNSVVNYPGMTINHSGDFTYQADYVINFSNPSNFSNIALRILTADSKVYQAEVVHFGSSIKSYRFYFETGYQGTTTYTGTSFTLKITRVGTTITAYIGGTTIYSGTGSGANVTGIYVGLGSQDSNSPSTTVDNVSFVDGSSNPVYIDPSGQPCVNDNEQWKKCADDTNAAILTYSTTPADYAWLCLSGVWVKCYNDSLTATVATDPSVLEQCGTIPTECADLVGWPADEDFGGTGCNSGTAGDTNWGVRWKSFSAGGTASIVSSKMRLACNTANPSFLAYTNQAIATGNFTYIGKGTFTNFSTSNISQSNNFRIHNSAGTFLAQIIMNKFASSSSSTWSIQVYNGSNHVIITNWASDYVYFKIERVGTTISFYYSSDGLSWTNSGFTLTSSASMKTVVGAFSRWTGGNLTVDWDNLSYTGFADIDPSGEACT